MSLKEPDLIKRVGVFVMSCDKTVDVAKHFIHGLEKYWAEIDFPVFFGTNGAKSHLESTQFEFIPVNGEIGGWKNETLAQMSEIKEQRPELTHMIVILDDFIFYDKVNARGLREKVIEALKNNWSYLKLKQLEEGFFFRFINFLRPKASVFKIRRNHPYYSSLQIALWDIDYLRGCIEQCKSIWEFEHYNQWHRPHYSVKDSLFKYRHLVEKGEWEVDSEEFCKQSIEFFEPGNRPVRSLSGLARAKFLLRKPIFFLFGYTIVRLKR